MKIEKIGLITVLSIFITCLALFVALIFLNNNDSLDSTTFLMGCYVLSSTVTISVIAYAALTVRKTNAERYEEYLREMEKKN